MNDNHAKRARLGRVGQEKDQMVMSEEGTRCRANTLRLV